MTAASGALLRGAQRFAAAAPRRPAAPLVAPKAAAWATSAGWSAGPGARAAVCAARSTDSAGAGLSLGAELQGGTQRPAAAVAATAAARPQDAAVSAYAATGLASTGAVMRGAAWGVSPAGAARAARNCTLFGDAVRSSSSPPPPSRSFRARRRWPFQLAPAVVCAQPSKPCSLSRRPPHACACAVPVPQHGCRRGTADTLAERCRS